MSPHRPSPRPVVFVAVDGPKAPLPEALEANAARGRLQLETYDSISAAAIASNQVLKATLRKTRDSGGRLHLFGLLSDGGVHSSLAHLFALIEAAKSAGVRVVVHAFLDGMDVSTGTALKFAEELESKLDGGVGRIGTVSGRTFGMAPEGRWDRIEKLYRAVMADNVERIDTARRGIEQATMFGVPEQFVAPFVVFDYPGVSLVDTGLHVNFAPDGARELTHALAGRDFTRFTRKGGRAPFGGRFTSMTPYDSSLELQTLFPRAPDPSELPLDLLGASGRPALNFSDGAALEMARATAEAIRSGKYAFVLADLANPSNATRSASEAVAGAIDQIAAAAHDVGGAVMVLGGRDAADSVPFVYLGAEDFGARIREGARASDLAPTVLELLEVPRPSGMEGASLLVR
jgi:2,3-bisphosphoglycerate-independent phosphoglycerate mutase